MTARRSPQDAQPADPREQGPKPEYPQPPQEPPGLDSNMVPRADHGEESYRGLGRLTDRVYGSTSAEGSR